MRIFVSALILLGLLLAGCDSDANVASRNISQEADQFRINRRIVFINGITDKYLLVVEGFCSLGNFDDEDELTITCKIENGEYVKHYLGLSDNVTYIAEQIDSAGVSPNHYKVIFKPSTIIPDIDIE